jgi:hypothetical protein
MMNRLIKGIDKFLKDNNIGKTGAMVGGGALGLTLGADEAEAGNYVTKLLKAFNKPQSTKYWQRHKMNELGITNAEFIPGKSGHGTLRLKFKDGRTGEVSGIQSSPGMDQGNAIENTMRDIKNGIKYDKVGADTRNQGNRFQWVTGAGATAAAGGAQASETPNMDRLGLSNQYDPDKMQGVIDFGKDVVTDPAVAGEVIGGGILSAAGAVSPWIKGAGLGLLLDSGEAQAAEDPNFMNKLQQQGIL